MKATIKLSEKEVEKIILDHLLKKFKVVNSVELKVGTEYRGIGPGEIQTTVFKAAECEVEFND